MAAGTLVLTAMALLVPVMVLVLVSVAVSVWLPGVMKITLKMPSPEVKALSAGRAAALSVLEKWTVPA